jgi:hypothetical protein
MVLLDAEPVPRMLPPQTFFKDCQNFPVLHGLRARFWVEQGWPNAT